VHGIVVLTPLTALLAILCALVPAVRHRLIWLVAALALATVALTPLTASAGEWLEQHVGSSPAVETHADRGDDMIFFVLGLAVAVLLMVVAHVWEGRGRRLPRIAPAVIAVVVVLASLGNMYQVYRVGDSGARAAWGGLVATSR
jgi:hypothetical protein